MPIIKEFYQEHGDGDVVVIGVAPFETAIQARNYVRDGGYDWTLVLDGNGEVTRSYGVFLVPTYFFVDREGLVRAVSISPVTASALESKLAELAAEPRV
jgi:alkyl hydroperoxide reductase subunit AhpC